MKDNAIIVDLDGTLSNSDKRKHLVENTTNKNWDMFYSEIKNDPVNKWCAEIVKTFHEKGVAIIIMTGRPDRQQVFTDTVDWLFENEIYYDALYMRKDHDYRPDYEIKLEYFTEKIMGHYNVLFCLEDRSSVVKMWRHLGLTCLQCAEGNF